MMPLRLNALNAVRNNLLLYVCALITTLEMQAIRGLSNEFNTKYYLKGKLDRETLLEYCRFSRWQYDYYFNLKASRPSPWFSHHFL